MSELTTIQKVMRRVLEMQTENARHLLFTRQELDEAAAAFHGETLYDVERTAENAIVRHKNVLLFTPDGQRRARAAYGDDGPTWWKDAITMSAAIGEARLRLRALRKAKSA